MESLWCSSGVEKRELELLKEITDVLDCDNGIRRAMIILGVDSNPGSEKRKI